MTEDELLKAVLKTARLFKWTTAHFRSAQTQRGNWITAVSGDGKGYPDLTMVRGDRLCFVELKSAKGKVRPEQVVWLALLEATPADVFIWRPAQWQDGTIERYLST